MSRRSGKCWIMSVISVGLLVVAVSLGRAQSTNASTKRVFKATSILSAPFLMTSQEGNESRWKGIIVDLLDEVGKIINASFQIVLVEDGRYGHQNKEGNWTGMIGEVKSGFADIAAAPLTLTAQRLLHVDMSHPFITFGLRIVIKKPAMAFQNSMFFILEPFTAVVWVLILIACGVAGLALGVIGRFSPFEWTNTSAVQVDREKRESFNWRNSFWYVLTTFMRQGYHHFPRSYSGRILSICWWIFTLLLLVLYFGCMTARLQSSTNRMTGLPFITFSEMSRQTKVTYGTLKMSSTLKYFQNSNRPTEQRIYDNMIRSEDNLVSTINEGIKKVRSSNGRYAFIMEGSGAEYLTSRYPCDLMIVGDDIHMRGYSFVTNKGSSLSSEINYAIVNLREAGVIERIHSKWQKGECFQKLVQEKFVDGKVYYDKMKGPIVSSLFSSLGPRLIAGPLILLLIGIVLSGIVLAAEVFWAKEEIKRGSLSTEDGHQLNDNFEDGN